MTNQQSNDRSGKPAEFLAASYFLDLGKRTEAMLEAQNELLIAFENLNRDWANRAKSEAKLASDATVKLMTVRSLPDAASVCQEWMDKRLDLWRRDSHWLLTDGQKFVQAGTRFVFNSLKDKPPAAT